ncbi:MAG: methionyl-tRNA formyltransferase, partial [Candidatus Omnitrophica bacterium]|nr:methionyl-tRNA formyltransferase [Candidatus Omnitrophota bacterium]
RMSGRMDAGAVILQRKILVELGDDAVTLTEKLSREGASLLGEALGKITANDFTLTPQDEAGVTFAPRLKKEDGLIDWKRPALEVHNLIRGCLSWPGAFSHYRGKLLKIYQAKPLQPCGREQLCYEPGEVVRAQKDGIIVSCASSLLSVGELQLEGKRRMTAQEFIAGHKIRPGEKFSNK